MALNHVAIRNEHQSFSSTSPSEAVRLYPMGLSASTGQFMCEVCMQYTTLVAGGKNRPHFKHKRGSNDCDEKLTLERIIYAQTNPLGFSLPIRIKMDSHLHISIGFLPLSNLSLDQAAKNKAKVNIVPCKTGKVLYEPRSYYIDQLRFSSDRISYIDIGSLIAEQYRLSFTSEGRFTVGNEFWPHSIDGFCPAGTLFDGNSGKRLPNRSTVVVEREYFLFTKRAYINVDRTGDVVCKHLNQFSGWSVYSVKANRLSRSSVDFFRSLSLFLTDSPSSVTLLWPTALRSSHCISFCGDKTFFHKTNGHVSIYPTNAAVKQKSDSFFSVESSFQQILSISRFEEQIGVLRYTLLRKEQDIVRTKYLTPTHMFDIENMPLETGIYHVLPKEKKIIGLLDFDGCVDVLNANSVVNRINVKAGERFTIEVEFNRKYRIFQGIDLVSELAFEQKKDAMEHIDADIVRKLKTLGGARVPVSHELGSVATQLSGLPQTRSWLLKQIRRGEIDERALCQLKLIIERGK